MSLGTGSLALALVMLARDLARWWRRRSTAMRSKAEERALARLRVLRDRYLGCDEKTPDLFLKVNRVLRRFLREQCGIPAPVETTRRLRECFRGHPLEKELAQLLERFNSVIYDGYHPTPSEREGSIRDVATLIGQLGRGGCPTHGGNGAIR